MPIFTVQEAAPETWVETKVTSPMSFSTVKAVKALSATPTLPVLAVICPWVKLPLETSVSPMSFSNRRAPPWQFSNVTRPMDWVTVMLSEADTLSKVTSPTSPWTVTLPASTSDRSTAPMSVSTNTLSSSFSGTRMVTSQSPSEGKLSS